MQVFAIFPAAGLGTRMAGPQPKQFLALNGIPILIHSLRVFAEVKRVTSIYVAVRKPEIERTQDVLAKMLLTKEVQVAFNGKKGSLPVRTDIDIGLLDACAQIGMQVLKDPAKQLPGPDWLATPDMLTTLQDVDVEFWASKTMTPEQFAEKYATVVANSQK